MTKFPAAIDSFYTVADRTEASLVAMSLVESDRLYLGEGAASFPESGGIVRVGSELLSYKSVASSALVGLSRGLSGTAPVAHKKGTVVKLVVAADHHNSLAEAVVALEKKVGVVGDLPDAQSRVLSRRAEFLRLKWDTPRAVWRATSDAGPAPLTVQFVDLSRGFPIRRRWDFGRAGSSSETDPVVTFTDPGTYDVSLAVYCADGKTARTLKRNAITVYPHGVLGHPALAVLVVGKDGSLKPGLRGRAPLTVWLVDQTPGDVVRRTFGFGDGQSVVLEGAWNHRVRHVYSEPGFYRPVVHVDGVNVAELGNESRVSEPPGPIEALGPETVIEEASAFETSTPLGSLEDCDPGDRPSGSFDPNVLEGWPPAWCEEPTDRPDLTTNCEVGPDGLV